MKFALLLITLVSAHAFADVSIPAQRCTNPGRGLVLMLPEIALGKLTSDFQIKHLDRVLVSVAPSSVSNLKVGDNGAFEFDGSDANGQPFAKVATARDSVGRLVVEVRIKDQGLIGFACSLPKAN